MLNLRNSLKEHHPSRGFRVLSWLLDAIYKAAGPRDFAARMLVNRIDYRPIWMRRRNGSASQIEMACAEFMAVVHRCSFAAMAPPAARSELDANGSLLAEVKFRASN